MGTRVSVSVHPDPETFRLVEFPDSEAGPFVSLRLGDVALLVSEPAVLSALITLAGQGEAWLIAAATDHRGGPESAPELDLRAMPMGWPDMSVVGAAVLLGLIVVVLLKLRAVRPTAALVCVLFGLVLGVTPSAAPSTRRSSRSAPGCGSRWRRCEEHRRPADRTVPAARPLGTGPDQPSRGWLLRKTVQLVLVVVRSPTVMIMITVAVAAGHIWSTVSPWVDIAIAVLVAAGLFVLRRRRPALFNRWVMVRLRSGGGGSGCTGIAGRRRWTPPASTSPVA